MPGPVSVRIKTIAEVTVTTAGTRVPLSVASVLVYAVSVQSYRTNTGYQYIGDDTVSSANGYEFAPSDVAEIEPPLGSKEPQQFDLKDIYVDATVNNSKFRVVAWIRR